MRVVSNFLAAALWVCSTAHASVSGFPTGPYTIDFGTGTSSSSDASSFTGNGQGTNCTSGGNFCDDAEVEGVYQWFVEDANTAYFAFSLNNTGAAGAISRAGFFTPFAVIDENTGNFHSGLTIDLFEVTSSDDCFSTFTAGVNDATCTGDSSAWAYTSPLNDWTVDEVKNGDFPVLGSSIFAVDFVGEANSSRDRIKTGESSAFIVRFQDVGGVIADFDTFATGNFTEDGAGGGLHWCVRWQGQGNDNRSDSACGADSTNALPDEDSIFASEPLTFSLFAGGLLAFGVVRSGAKPSRRPGAA